MLRKLVGYATYMFGANLFTAGLNFAVSALGMVTRPKAAFGDYAIYMLIYEIGNGVFINGANATIQRFSADDPINRLRFAKLIFLVFFGLSAVTGALAAFVGPVFGLNYALALIGLPWVVTYWYGRYIVRSTLDARREARLMVVASLSNTIFQFIFLTATDLRDALIYGDFLALLASGAIAMVTIPAAVGAPLKEILKTPLPREFLKEALSFTVPLWWAGQVYSAKARIHGVWTTARLGSKAMGALQALQTMWQFAGKPMEFIGQASLPGLVAAKDERDVLYRELLRFCLLALPVVGIAVAGGIPLVFIVIDFVSGLLGADPRGLSEKYAEVPLLISIVALAVPMTAVEMVTNQYAVAIGRPKTVFYAQVANVITLLIVTVPLTLEFGLVGVVISGALGEVVNALTFVVVLRKDRADSMRSALVWATWASLFTAVGLALIHYGRNWAFNWVLTAPAILVFVLGMAAVRLLKPEDFRRVLGAIRARRGG